MTTKATLNEVKQNPHDLAVRLWAVGQLTAKGWTRKEASRMCRETAIEAGE